MVFELLTRECELFLTLRLTRTPKGWPYRSSRISTQGLRNFTKGRVLARIKAPKGKGLWPAFWMLGADVFKVSWPNCGEIDIFEMVGGARVHLLCVGLVVVGGVDSRLSRSRAIQTL